MFEFFTKGWKSLFFPSRLFVVCLLMDIYDNTPRVLERISSNTTSKKSYKVLIRKQTNQYRKPWRFTIIIELSILIENSSNREIKIKVYETEVKRKIEENIFWLKKKLKNNVRRLSRAQYRKNCKLRAF